MSKLWVELLTIIACDALAWKKFLYCKLCQLAGRSVRMRVVGSFNLRDIPQGVSKNAQNQKFWLEKLQNQKKKKITTETKIKNPFFCPNVVTMFENYSKCRI